MGTRRELFFLCVLKSVSNMNGSEKRTDDPNTKKGTKKIPTDVLFPEKIRSGC